MGRLPGKVQPKLPVSTQGQYLWGKIRTHSGNREHLYSAGMCCVQNGFKERTGAHTKKETRESSFCGLWGGVL